MPLPPPPGGWGQFPFLPIPPPFPTTGPYNPPLELVPVPMGAESTSSTSTTTTTTTGSYTPAMGEKEGHAEADGEILQAEYEIRLRKGTSSLSRELQWRLVMDLPVSARLAGPALSKDYDAAVTSLIAEEEAKARGGGGVQAAQGTEGKGDTSSQPTSTTKEAWLPLQRETQRILDAGIRKAFGFPPVGSKVSVRSNCPYLLFNLPYPPFRCPSIVYSLLINKPQRRTSSTYRDTSLWAQGSNCLRKDKTCFEKKTHCKRLQLQQ